MKSTIVTNYLLATIVVILLFKFFPELAHSIETGIAICIVIYAAFYLVFKAPETIRAGLKQNKRDKEDLGAWEQYSREAHNIAFKYDPNNKWNEGTITRPEQYQQELKTLRERYKDMLTRKFRF